MADEHRLNSYDDRPVYTIKTVVQDTGIAPATLRAWERRYGVLSPGRSDGGYRLYSERDVATLRWLKAQVDAGVSISRAVALLQMRHEAGEHPELELPRYARFVTAVGEIRGKESLINELVEALVAFQEPLAEGVLNEAFALYAVDVVAEEIMTPALVEIGERWHLGEVSVAQEHFATAFLRRRLATLFHAYPQPLAGPLAFTAAAPAEWHDVGILLVSMALRRHGWRVLYLGQNMPAEGLVREARKLKPDLICISAATPEGAAGLEPIYRDVMALPEGRPQLAFGGHAFQMHPELAERYPGAKIAQSARGFVDALS